MSASPVALANPATDAALQPVKRSGCRAIGLGITIKGKIKALAVLARTVRELVAIEEPPATRKDKRSDDPSAADDLRHVAQLRQDLARRLEALAAQDAGEASQEADADGDGG